MTQYAMIGTTELLLIVALALLLFGGKKLPEMMRGLGKGVSEYKKGLKEVSDEVESIKNTTLDESADASESNK